MIIITVISIIIVMIIIIIINISFAKMACVPAKIAEIRVVWGTYPKVSLCGELCQDGMRPRQDGENSGSRGTYPEAL